MVKLNHTLLQEHYGKAYPILFMHDIYSKRDVLHVKQYVSQDIEEEESLVSQVWLAIGFYARDMFAKTVAAIKNVAWPLLLTLKEVPKYLDSMMIALKKIANATGRNLVKYATAFMVGAQSLWKDLKNLIGTVELPEFKTAKAMSKALLNLLQSAGEMFVDLVHFLFKRIGEAVDVVRGLYGTAMENMSSFSQEFGSAFLRISSMGKDAFVQVQKTSLQTFIFGFVAMTDILQYASHLRGIVIEYIGKMTKVAHEMCNKVRTWVNAHIGSPGSIIMSVIESLYESPIIQSIIEALKSVKRDAFTWLDDVKSVNGSIALFKWLFGTLSNVLARISSTTNYYVKGFTVKVCKIVAGVLTWAGNRDEITGNVMNELQSIKKDCIIMSKDSHVSSHRKLNLIKAVRVFDGFEKQLENHRKDYVRNILTQNRTNAMRHPQLTSRVLTQLYFDEKPSLDDLNELFMIRFGYNVADFMDRVHNIYNLMQARIYEAIDELGDDNNIKTKISSIGNETVKNWWYWTTTFAWTKRKRQEEIQRIKILLEKETALYNRMVQSSNDYRAQLAKINALENIRITKLLDNADEKTVSMSTLLKRTEDAGVKAIENLQRRYPARFTRKIFDVVTQMREYEARIEMLNKNIILKQNYHNVFSWLIHMTFYGLAGYWLYNYGVQSYLDIHRSGMMKHFAGLLETTKMDVLTTRLVSRYIDMKIKKGSTTLMLTDFQGYIEDMNRDIIHGATTYDDVYSPNGKYNYLLSGLTSSLTEQAIRTTKGTAPDETPKLTAFGTVMEVIQNFVKNPKKLSENVPLDKAALIAPDDTGNYGLSDVELLTSIAITNGLDLVTKGVLKNANVLSTLRFGKKAIDTYRYRTEEQRQQAALNVFTGTLSMYSMGITKFIATTKDEALEHERMSRGFIASFMDGMSFMWEGSGGGGADADATITKAAQHIRKGHAPYIYQLMASQEVMFHAFMGYSYMFVTFINAMADVLTYVLAKETEQASEVILQTTINMLAYFTALRLSLYVKLISNFFSRFTVLGIVLQIGITAATFWFKAPVMFAKYLYSLFRPKEMPSANDMDGNKAEKEIIRKLRNDNKTTKVNYPITIVETCITCDSGVSSIQDKCTHCDRYYCSEACLALDWHQGDHILDITN